MIFEIFRRNYLKKLQIIIICPNWTKTPIFEINLGSHTCYCWKSHQSKNLRKFLPSNYEVLASMGHVRDLPRGAAEIPAAVKKEKWSRIGVNRTEDFEPLYICLLYTSDAADD